MEYYINFDDFEEFKFVFKKKVDEIDELIYKVFKSCQDVEWVGVGHDATINAIYQEIEQLGKVSQTLNKFLEFMDIVIDSYSTGVSDVKKYFNELEDIINTK